MTEEIKDTTVAEDQALIERLKELLKQKEQVSELDVKEITTLRKIIRVYESFLVFGRLAGAARNIVLFVGGLLVAWFTFVDNLGLLWIKLAALVGGGH
jgi:hypothetical protein